MTVANGRSVASRPPAVVTIASACCLLLLAQCNVSIAACTGLMDPGWRDDCPDVPDGTISPNSHPLEASKAKLICSLKGSILAPARSCFARHANCHVLKQVLNVHFPVWTIAANGTVYLLSSDGKLNSPTATSTAPPLCFQPSSPSATVPSPVLTSRTAQNPTTPSSGRDDDPSTTTGSGTLNSVDRMVIAVSAAVAFLILIGDVVIAKRITASAAAAALLEANADSSRGSCGSEYQDSLPDLSRKSSMVSFSGRSGYYKTTQLDKETEAKQALALQSRLLSTSNDKETLLVPGGRKQHTYVNQTTGADPSTQQQLTMDNSQFLHPRCNSFNNKYAVPIPSRNRSKTTSASDAARPMKDNGAIIIAGHNLEAPNNDWLPASLAVPGAAPSNNDNAVGFVPATHSAHAGLNQRLSYTPGSAAVPSSQPPMQRSNSARATHSSRTASSNGQKSAAAAAGLNRTRSNVDLTGSTYDCFSTGIPVSQEHNAEFSPSMQSSREAAEALMGCNAVQYVNTFGDNQGMYSDTYAMSEPPSACNTAPTSTADPAPATSMASTSAGAGVDGTAGSNTQASHPTGGGSNPPQSPAAFRRGSPLAGQVRTPLNASGQHPQAGHKSSNPLESIGSTEDAERAARNAENARFSTVSNPLYGCRFDSPELTIQESIQESAQESIQESPYASAGSTRPGSLEYNTLSDLRM